MTAARRGCSPEQAAQVAEGKKPFGRPRGGEASVRRAMALNGGDETAGDSSPENRDRAGSLSRRGGTLRDEIGARFIAVSRPISFDDRGIQRVRMSSRAGYVGVGVMKMNRTDLAPGKRRAGRFSLRLWWRPPTTATYGGCAPSLISVNGKRRRAWRLVPRCGRSAP